jgi:Uncharacterized protein encoded in toxicity protection region of plasmid R478, contains von Willebrand factor (vWF) domain
MQGGEIYEMNKASLNEDIQNGKGEFIIIIDMNGSKRGQRIENLRKALSKFIENLPQDSYFNIISFGGSYFCSQAAAKNIVLNPKKKS